MASTGSTSRSTAQKELVRRALDAAGVFVSAQELHQRMSEAGASVGLATVYRRLNALAESGDADTITGPAGQLFRACRQDAHHHHLVCDGCGTAVDIDPPEQEWLQSIAQANGFTVTRHVLEVFGLCANCQAEQ